MPVLIAHQGSGGAGEEDFRPVAWLTEKDAKGAVGDLLVKNLIGRSAFCGKPDLLDPGEVKKPPGLAEQAVAEQVPASLVIDHP